MKLVDLSEALKPSEYRKLVKTWDKNRYAEIFAKYPHDRNAYRIYLPLQQTKQTSKIEPQIQQALSSKGYQVKDYTSGIATDGRRDMRIGKLLASDPQLVQQFANDPARAATKQELMVVISRHPYDIAGMSTDRGWTSCMNLKSGVNRRYVPIDIKEGTLIAYLINSNDKNIENPLARILIKPFVAVSSASQEIMLGVENKVYGTANTAFSSTVTKWANQVNSTKVLDGLFVLQRGLYVDGVYKGKDEDADEDDIERPTKVWPPRSPKHQYMAIWDNPFSIKNIDNPSEKLQLTAVNRRGNAIKYIKDPSEQVQLAAVKQNGEAIKYIDNPSEQVKLAAAAYNKFHIESLTMSFTKFLSE
jgi:hypothetical protein